MEEKLHEPMTPPMMAIAVRWGDYVTAARFPPSSVQEVETKVHAREDPDFQE